jgi:hypothetical protein
LGPSSKVSVLIIFFKLSKLKFIFTESFVLGNLGTLPVNLVVGVNSPVFAISVSYPPATGVTLTPSSTDGLTFSPSSLLFTANINKKYFTITAPSLTNPNPQVTWAVTGDATFATPGSLTQIFVSNSMCLF